MSDITALIELIGEDATIKLIEAYGGTRPTVPKTFPAQHPMKELLGDFDFKNLHQYFGGCTLRLPLAKRWRLEIYRQRGMKTKEIARRTGYTERAVARIINEADAPRHQMALPF